MADKVDVYAKDARLGVFALTEWKSRDSSGTRFTQVGGASINRDGSVNMYLDLLPAKGQTLQLRTVIPKDDRPVLPKPDGRRG